MELKKLTTFHIGGKAQYYFPVRNIAELTDKLSFIRRKKLRFYVLGGGANLLVQDNVLKGAVIKLAGDFSAIKKNGNRVIAGSAVTLSKLVKFGAKNNLSGAEFLWGIPGTLGGAVKGNAGTKDQSIGQLVRSINGVSGLGNVEVFKGKDITFGYRCANIGDIFIITSVELSLHKSRENVIKRNIEIYRQKKSAQPWGYSAGCIFKNPSGTSAGALIDRAGLKGYKIGGAEISSQHANFIINKTGRAKAADVWRLIKLIRKKVWDVHGIKLEPEIKLWGDFK
jgi:UDP-N-acetylmuramate dehydrogenase